MTELTPEPKPVQQRHWRNWLEHRLYQHANPLQQLLCRPWSALFNTVARQRQQRSLARAAAPAVPVIIIGNLHVGGTGKSPVVTRFATAYLEAGLRVGLLLRGYGAQTSKEPLFVTESSSVAICGDEALMHSNALARFGEQLQVVIDPDRQRGAYALAKAGVEVILADDGLQHYGLARDVEVVVVNAGLPLGPIATLPCGPLREPLQRLERVDKLLSQEQAPSAWLTVMPSLASKLCVYQTTTDMPVGILNHQAWPGSVRAKLVTSIARPERVVTSLAKFGIQVEAHCFADHQTLTQAMLEAIDDETCPLIMTSKDQVKVSAFTKPHWFVIPLKVEIPLELIHNLLELACNRCARRSHNSKRDNYA